MVRKGSTVRVRQRALSTRDPPRQRGKAGSGCVGRLARSADQWWSPGARGCARQGTASTIGAVGVSRTFGGVLIGPVAAGLLVAVVIGLEVAAIAGAASSRAHVRGSHRPPVYRGTQGGGGGACSNTPFPAGGGAVSDSKVLEVRITSPSYISAGDLLLAAVSSQRHLTAPSGWSAVSSTGPASSGVRLQVFYEIAGSSVSSPSFAASTPQRMSGEVLDVQGVSSGYPIGASGGQVNPSADSVTAPSVAPASMDSLLVFVGATESQPKWTVPTGMNPQYLSGSSQPVRLFMATESWHPAGATGSRSARISIATPSVGQLIALHYPEPATCPKVNVLSYQLPASARGVVSVRMKCAWAAACHGWLEGGGEVSSVQGHAFFGPPLVAVGQYSIPAGQTRTVPIALTRHGREELKKHHSLPIGVELWAVRSNGQLGFTANVKHKTTVIAANG